MGLTFEQAWRSLLLIILCVFLGAVVLSFLIYLFVSWLRKREVTVRRPPSPIAEQKAKEDSDSLSSLDEDNRRRRHNHQHEKQQKERDGKDKAEKKKKDEGKNTEGEHPPSAMVKLLPILIGE